MIRLNSFLAIAIGAIVLHTCPAHACRYNVREVGFIDLGIDPYYLLAYVPADVNADEVDALRDQMEVSLAETNIRFEPRLADTDPNDPSMQYVKTYEISEFPAAVLVSPDGQSRQLTLREEGAELSQKLSAALQGVLHSPKRKTILENCADNYGVALLLEGPDAGENAQAREAIATAIAAIKEQLEFMPKPMGTAPVMVVVEQDALVDEEMLLWSLGLEAADVNAPHAAVLYGRGRWFGPMFRDDSLNADNLTEMLFIIGADCECGLDHRWLQGTMLPARWSERYQAKVAESLGFDPENPMVKMEMVSIIRRGMGGFAYPSTPFGYQEVAVGDEPAEAPEPLDSPDVASSPETAAVAETVEEPSAPEPNAAMAGAGHDAAVPAPPAPAPPVAEPTAVEVEQGSESGMLLAFLGGGTLVIALAGIIVFFKTKSA